MAHNHESFVILREVDAVMVPSGIPIKLQPGLAGFISQALGGSCGATEGSLPMASASLPARR